MKQIIRTMTLAVAALAAGAAMAHHSAVQFDFTRQVSYTGVVKDFAAINPHMRLVIELNDEKGKREVRFEGHSTNNMYRGGYRKGMVKVGDTITVNAPPFRGGTEGGHVVPAETKECFFGPRCARAQDQRAIGEESRRQAEGR